MACPTALYMARPLQGSLRGLLATGLPTGRAISRALYRTRPLLGTPRRSLAPKLSTEPARSDAPYQNRSPEGSLQCLPAPKLTSKIALYSLVYARGPTPRCLHQGLFCAGATTPRIPTQRCSLQGYLLRGVYSEVLIPRLFYPRLLTLRSCASPMSPGADSFPKKTQPNTCPDQVLWTLQSMPRIPRKVVSTVGQTDPLHQQLYTQGTKPIPRTPSLCPDIDYIQEPSIRSLSPGACAQEQGSRQTNLWGEVPRGGELIVTL